MSNRTEKPEKKLKLLLIGIAGTNRDFLLSLHVLKSYAYQNPEIKENMEIDILQEYYIPPEDMVTNIKSIIDEITRKKPDIIGFSCYVWNIDAVKSICDEIKGKIDAKILYGGPEITIEDAANFRFDDYNVDYMIFGEGEKKFQKLLSSIIKNDESYKNIKGFAYRNKSKFELNYGEEILENFENIPSPYLEGYVSDEILLRKDIRVNIETQRGCNFKCAYCFYHKNFPRVKYRNANDVVKEIDYAFKKGIKMGRIVDANFLSNKEYAMKILQGLIDRKVHMALFCEIVPLFLDEDIAKLFGEYVNLSSNNKITVGMGIQTITQKPLEIIRRKIPVKFFDKAFKLLQDNNVIIKTDIILGLPQETYETYLQTLEFVCERMRRGTNYLSLSLLMILPGSDMVEIAEKENIVVDMRDNSHFIHSTSTMSREELIQCMKLNIIAYRILNAMDIPERLAIRDKYFEVKDKLEISNVEILGKLVTEFFNYLDEQKIDYIHENHPSLEYYKDFNCKEIYVDIPNIVINETLNKILLKH